MGTARVLYVGEDVCHRIPVIEREGMVVVHTECTVRGVIQSLATGETSGVTFNNDECAPPKLVVMAARKLCDAPLILLENPFVRCDDELFDLVIPVPTAPGAWSRTLRQAIEHARNLRETSRRLRQECADATAWSRNLREISARNRVVPIDCSSLFRGEREGTDGESNDS